MPKTPINYSTACVYQIVCKDLEIKDMYVGSTTNLIERRRTHKVSCTNKSGRKYNYPVYQFIRQNGGWDNWEVIKMQDVDCACREDLLKTERSVMERLSATLNKRVPSRSQGERYEANKIELSEKKKEYYQSNKTEIIEKSRQYQKAHKTEVAERKKKHYEANKTEIIEKSRQYKEANKTELAEKAKVKVTCQCGSVVTKAHMARHCTSKKHKAYLESLK